MTDIALQVTKQNKRLKHKKEALSEIIDKLVEEENAESKHNVQQLEKLVKVEKNLDECIGEIRHIDTVEDCYSLPQKTASSTSFEGPFVQMIKVRKSQCPKFDFAHENMTDIMERFKNVLQSNGKEVEDEKYISFCVFSSKGNDTVINDFLYDPYSRQNIISKTNIGTVEQFLQSDEPPIVSFFVVPGNMEHLLSKIDNRTSMIFVIVNTDQKARATLKIPETSGKATIFFLRSKEAWKEVDTVLEKRLFENLKHICEDLSKNIASNKLFEKGPDVKNDTNSEPGKRKFTCTPFENDSNRMQKKRKSDKHRANDSKKGTCDNKQKEKRTDIYLRTEMLSTLKLETKVGLLEEIMGLFFMSNVSNEDVPNVSGWESNIDLKKISQVLFSKVKGVHGIGYRMQKLQITLKDGEEFNTSTIRDQIRQVLHDFNVNEYELLSLSMCKYLAPGDEIFVSQDAEKTNYGTLSCFAEMEEKEEDKTIICGILSKHLVQTGTKLCVKEDGEDRIVGNMISETVIDGGIDIAAALLTINKRECDPRFKSLSGERMPGKLQTIPFEKLKGWKVHMWGARSKPGRGIITVPQFICKGIDYPLMQIEDIENEDGTVDERFAKPGDSGAIACNNVPGKEFLNPVAMIIGIMNKNNVYEGDNENRQERGKYLTLPLSIGLEELSKRLGKKIKLCEMIDM